MPELLVNGVTSRNSTFSIRGSHAVFTCDFDEANSIVARCTTPGNQIIDVTTSFKYADTNRYRVKINVNCRLCPAGGDGAGGGREIPGEPVPAPRG